MPGGGEGCAACARVPAHHQTRPPSSPTVVARRSMWGNHEEEVGALIFWEYCVALVALPAWMVTYVWCAVACCGLPLLVGTVERLKRAAAGASPAVAHATPSLPAHRLLDRFELYPAPVVAS